ncbi:MAG TPA: hypothetical protein VGB94_02620 [Acidobacteriaceae bacterium]
MKITIDNHDGLGAVDYSARLCTEKPLEIKRTLNEPSLLAAMMDCSDGGKVPVRGARVRVLAENEVVLFSGVLSTEPVAVYTGAGLKGAVYRSALRAISEEWLLNQLGMTVGGAGYAQNSGELLEALAARVDGTALRSAGTGGTVNVGVFQPQAAQSWSANAGELAGSAYAAYRVLDGALAMRTVGGKSHAFAAEDGTLNPAGLTMSEAKEFANDITLTGEMEPSDYVTEYFLGDGTTAAFEVRHTPSAKKQTLVNDSFSLGVFNRQVWSVNDAGSHMGFAAAGLLLSGGTSYDGQTTLATLDQVELGGALVFEVGSVQLSPGSDGVLCGVYSGTTSIGNCFAGYRVKQSGGTTTLVPLVNGSEVGTAFAVKVGHAYTLRLRLHCVELQRVMQVYYAMVAGKVTQFGGGMVDAPMAIVLELQDNGLASSTPATVLYDGVVNSSPATCNFVPVNSANLLGTIGYIRATQNGSGWVVSTPVGEAVKTRLIGAAGEGVDCAFAGNKVTFYAGRIPAADELIAVSYRMQQRSVARLADTASIPLQTAAGEPATARWMGSVRAPVARSTADCESAAEAVLSFATDRAAAIAGRYATVNLQQSSDVWPGDLISVTCDDGDSTMEAIVRSVTIEDEHCAPEKLSYTIAFANDWAEALSMKLSTSVAADALLPLYAVPGPAPVLGNLQQMKLTGYSATALDIDAGMTAPMGGGFEVRRREGDFWAGADQDLVLRSPVRSFTIPRAAQFEEYFVRAYDGATPPVYSRFSSVIGVDIPVG